jgi:hypothetical protein
MKLLNGKMFLQLSTCKISKCPEWGRQFKRLCEESFIIGTAQDSSRKTVTFVSAVDAVTLEGTTMKEKYSYMFKERQV